MEVLRNVVYHVFCFMCDWLTTLLLRYWAISKVRVKVLNLVLSISRFSYLFDTRMSTWRSHGLGWTHSICLQAILVPRSVTYSWAGKGKISYEVSLIVYCTEYILERNQSHTFLTIYWRFSVFNGENGKCREDNGKSCGDFVNSARRYNILQINSAPMEKRHLDRSAYSTKLIHIHASNICHGKMKIYLHEKSKGRFSCKDTMQCGQTLRSDWLKLHKRNMENKKAMF